MSIKREDVDAGRIDFAEVVTGKRLPPIHPGEIIKHDILPEVGLSVTAAAKALGVSRQMLHGVLAGRKPDENSATSGPDGLGRLKNGGIGPAECAISEWIESRSTRGVKPIC